jgi:hypothetical protein
MSQRIAYELVQDSNEGERVLFTLIILGSN